ncbi:uncharacterized protein LOC128601236 isoform X2 [Ictalurus furcatus]|uniref:uncharacterized protein LOC128601236 isoform X2 n=1 Tax=Ictalurus furcatus TaxID=66913 RepID=UPI00235084EF|nr:uncharacterized protein LOC128601236 isoform X2 [Ictalurus furcatus]
MITLFVALYSLFSLCTAVTSDIKELHVKTVKCGENVTMECSISMSMDIDKHKYKDKLEKLVLYRQRFGKVPQYFVRYYGESYTVVDEFKDSRFSTTKNDQKFELKISELKEDDGGDYLCGEVEGTVLKFTSGTRLQFEGSNEGPKSSDGKGGDIWIIVLLSLLFVSLIVNVVLLGVLYKNQRKGASSRNHQTPTNQADDEDVLNYAAVSFAKKPSSSRTSRDKSHEDVYAQVKIK